MGFYDFWIGKLPCEMRFPPLIRGCSYIGLPHVLGLKPCGAGGFAASLSRRRGTPKTTGARKRQGRHRCRNSIGPYRTKTTYFHRLTSFRMNVECSIWVHLAPNFLPGPFSRALVPRMCAKYGVQYHLPVNHCATNANRCSDPTLKQFTSLKIQIFTVN